MLGRTTSLLTCGCCIADGWTHTTRDAYDDVLRERTDGRTFTDEAAAALTRLGFKFENER
jgi:Arc/MetJ family transcription regulator